MKIIQVLFCNNNKQHTMEKIKKYKAFNYLN